MWNKWIRKNRELGLFFLRVIIGYIFFVHGSQKVFGLFGGSGIVETSEQFDKLGLFYPGIMAWIVSLLEFAGGMALFLGAFTRESSFILGILMMGAILLVHGKNGFAVAQQGYEYALAMLGACVCLFFNGGGLAAVDNILFPKPPKWQFIRDRNQIKLEPPSYE